MPKFDSSKKDIESLFGKQFTIPELESALEYAKCELDGQEGDLLKIECKETNRPDLWSPEGVVRELKARIGKERGVKEYKLQKSGVEVFIDKNLESVRPLIACAIVKGVSIDENFIIQMVNIQEKIGENFGRKRKELGIGLYDLDVMKPPVYYKGFKDDAIEFVPLEWKVSMRPSEILAQHEKGKAYKHLLEGASVYPIVIDSANTVASMPPIINSQTTGKVTENTKNLFIEVTGFNWNIVETALEVMCMALVDRGGKLFSCKINFPADKKPYPAKTLNTPTFEKRKMSFDKSLVEKKTGVKFTDKELKDLLERARYEATIKGNKVSVEFSSYRVDVMHPVDVVEDIIISHGYNNITPARIEMSVVGSELPMSIYQESVKNACVGLGLQEIMTYNMTSKEIQSKNLFLEDELVEINNAVSTNYCVLRKRLSPQALDFLSKNKDKEFPQKLFEVGICVSPNHSSPTGVTQTTNVSVVLTHSNVNFTEIKSYLAALCKYLGFNYEIKKKSFAFLNENAAEITVNGKKGFIGELKQEVISSFGLRKPVALFEFEL